jgi:hypothetical protein
MTTEIIQSQAMQDLWETAAMIQIVSCDIVLRSVFDFMLLIYSFFFLEASFDFYGSYEGTEARLGPFKYDPEDPLNNKYYYKCTYQ